MLPNKVALASLVWRMPACQAARSAAKNSPPSRIVAAMPRLKPANGALAPIRAIASRNGTAIASRQNAAATGPTSASRTIHGPNARKALARISAAKAYRPALREGIGWCMAVRRR